MFSSDHCFRFGRRTEISELEPKHKSLSSLQATTARATTLTRLKNPPLNTHPQAPTAKRAKRSNQEITAGNVKGEKENVIGQASRVANVADVTLPTDAISDDDGKKLFAVQHRGRYIVFYLSALSRWNGGS